MKPISEARIVKNKHAEKDTDKLTEIVPQRDRKSRGRSASRGFESRQRSECMEA